MTPENLKSRCPDCRYADIQDVKWQVIKATAFEDIFFSETILFCKICEQHYDAYNAAFLELLSAVEELLKEPDSKSRQTVLKNCVRFLKGE